MASLLLDYSLLGLVYARFSSPTNRISSIRFSKSIYMALENDHLVLSAKVSNVRRQTVLNPAVRLLLALEVPTEGGTCDESAGNPLCLMVCTRAARACSAPAL